MPQASQELPLVPFYDAPTSTLTSRVRFDPRQIGKLLGKDGAWSGDDGCGCRPLWWLLVAGLAGAGIGALAKGEKRRKRRKG